MPITARPFKRWGRRESRLVQTGAEDSLLRPREDFITTKGVLVFWTVSPFAGWHSKGTLTSSSHAVGSPIPGRRREGDRGRSGGARGGESASAGPSARVSRPMSIHSCPSLIGSDGLVELGLRRSSLIGQNGGGLPTRNHVARCLASRATGGQGNAHAAFTARRARMSARLGVPVRRERVAEIGRQCSGPEKRKVRHSARKRERGPSAERTRRSVHSPSP